MRGLTGGVGVVARGEWPLTATAGRCVVVEADGPPRGPRTSPLRASHTARGDLSPDAGLSSRREPARRERPKGSSLVVQVRFTASAKRLRQSTVGNPPSGDLTDSFVPAPWSSLLLSSRSPYAVTRAREGHRHADHSHSRVRRLAGGPGHPQTGARAQSKYCYGMAAIGPAACWSDSRSLRHWRYPCEEVRRPCS
jgi:hypothetical protein